VTFSEVPPVESPSQLPQVDFTPVNGGMLPPHSPLPGVKVNRLAIVAVCVWPVLGLGSIASIVLGHTAMAQIKRTRQRGLVLALIGLVLGYLSLLASVIAVAVLLAGLVAPGSQYLSAISNYSSPDDPSGSSTYSQSVASSELKTGDCFSKDALDGTSAATPTIACSKTHDNEAFAIATVPTLPTFPGDSALAKTADALCRPLFEKFVGATLDRTNLDYSEIYPTAETWSSGDRAVLCYAFEDDNSVTGTLEGKGSSYPLSATPAT